MNTYISNQLTELTPTLCDLVRYDNEIGNYDDDREWCSNFKSYEDEHWTIEIEYKCTGDVDYWPGDYYQPAEYNLRSAYGELEEIRASYYDEETNFEYELTEKDLDGLWKDLSETLEDLV